MGKSLKFRELSLGKKIAVVLGGLFVVGSISNAVNPQSNNSQTPPTNATQSSLSAPIDTSQKHKLDTVEKKTETKTEVAPFETTTQNDATLASGQTSTTPGVNGERTITYEVTYTNGKETKRVEVSNTITKQPVAQVNKVGTKSVSSYSSSCSGGYINSAGNCVQSPGSSPAGASARCGDGTYSYSQNRRGTCSHHGGVAEWL